MLVFTTLAYAAETAHQSTASTAGIGALGVDAKSILFQIINFAIVLFVLYKIAYKPIIKVIEERRHTVENSLQTAKEIEQAKQEFTEHQKLIINDARSKAESIIQEGQTQAKAIINDAETQARERVTQMIKEAEARIEQSANDARGQIRHEIVELVALATEQVLGEKLDKQKDESLIVNSIKDLTAPHKGNV